jgi:hypothetical protein
MVDPELSYDAGWDRVEDDHGLSEWHVGLDDERNDDHPGRHRNGRFARDRAKDLTTDAALNAGAQSRSTPATRSYTSRSGPAGNSQGRRTPDSRTTELLRTNLKKEAKARGVPKANLLKERLRRYGNGESIVDITRFPPTTGALRTASAPSRSSTPPATKLKSRSLPPDVEKKLRAHLKIEAKRREVPKDHLWAERVRRYQQGESIAVIVSQPTPGNKRRTVPATGKPRQLVKVTVRIQDHPVYRGPTSPLRPCLACGAPEISCRC